MNPLVAVPIVVTSVAFIFYGLRAWAQFSHFQKQFGEENPKHNPNPNKTKITPLTY